MAADDNNDTIMSGQGDTIDDSSLDKVADKDLETQMAAEMEAESGDDDLEAQMAAAMTDESGSEDDLEAQMAATMALETEGGEFDLEAQMATAMAGEDEGGEFVLDDLEDDSGAAVSPVSFQQLHPSDEKIDSEGIERLMDVSLNISVELGRKQMQIKEILGLGPGKIIELDKLAGEPVDLLVNGKLLAKGEVVVVDENFGVRITDLINPKDRIRML